MRRRGLGAPPTSFFIFATYPRHQQKKTLDPHVQLRLLILLLGEGSGVSHGESERCVITTNRRICFGHVRTFALDCVQAFSFRVCFSDLILILTNYYLPSHFISKFIFHFFFLFCVDKICFCYSTSTVDHILFVIMGWHNLIYIY